VANQLGKIQYIVQVMLENRSLDHMLGYLYADSGNVSPAGQAFDGLTGDESNPDATGRSVAVYAIQADDPHPYLMPGADPGEGFLNTNSQLFSTDDPAPGAAPSNQGFVANFKAALASDLAKH
jgi:phospholipase C